MCDILHFPWENHLTFHKVNIQTSVLNLDYKPKFHRVLLLEFKKSPVRNYFAALMCNMSVLK